MTQLLEDLNELLLFLQKDTWTTGYYAVNANGNPIDLYSNKACRWCVTGAMRKIANKDESRLADITLAIYKEFNKVIKGEYFISSINDTYGLRVIKNFVMDAKDTEEKRIEMEIISLKKKELRFKMG